MHVYSNIEARSPNHCCRGKVANMTYSECVSVALGTQPVMRMRQITVICNLPGSTILFPHYLTNRTILGEMLLSIKCVF